MSQKSFTIKIFLGIVFADEDDLFDILYDGCCIQKYYRTQDAEIIATKADTFGGVLSGCIYKLLLVIKNRNHFLFTSHRCIFL